MTNLMRGQNLINILLLSLGFILLFFAFVVIFFIPAGKAYKKEHKVYMQKMYLLDQSQEAHDQTLDNLKELQAKNRAIITAYGNLFDPQAFDRQYSRYFKRLKLTAMKKGNKEDIFDTYAVTTTSDIRTPLDFYEFLKAVNKSENIISIEFPINFKADGNVIQATFHMKVYSATFSDNIDLGGSYIPAKEEGTDL